MSKPSPVTRHDVVTFALKWNGWGDGSGYPGRPNNPACKFMGHGLEYSCADGVSFAFGKTGVPLIPMQPGFNTGYSYCPDGLEVARREKAVIPSWNTKPADILFINTGSGAQPGHTELVYKVTGQGGGREVWSIGWDSGPSNVDNYRGQGGVHLHVWPCPVGVGNPSIIAAADVSKLSPLLGKPQPKPVKAKGGHQPVTKTEKSQITNTSPLTPAQRNAIGRLIALLRRWLHR